VSCIKVDQWGIVNVANHPSVSVWWFVAMGNLASHVYNIIFLMNEHSVQLNELNIELVYLLLSQSIHMILLLIFISYVLND